MKLEAADRKKLAPLLDDLGRGVEDLVRSGLTTASESTRRELGVAFQEASRLRLLRLGSTLRVANEELGRFTRNDPAFSQKRMVFFLNRAWLLCRGLARALREGDDAELERLLYTPPTTPVTRVEVVTLGVTKRVATGAFVAFEFRMRSLSPAGERLIWSSVFPIKAGTNIPAEGYLHLPQPQKFKPTIFLEKRSVVVEQAQLSTDDAGVGRLSFRETTRVTPGAEFDSWRRFCSWDPQTALQRVRSREPSPFDLDIELQEEVVFESWSAGAATKNEQGRLYEVESGGATLEVLVPAGVEGEALGTRFERARKQKRRPPLFGVMHYEKRRLKLQPLALMLDEGPEYLTLSDETLDQSALLKALDFG